MAFQSEREPGVDMDLENVDSMVQDEIPEQEMLDVQDELPQPTLEPEMGAAAAAVYDTSPPPLRQNPPILVESAQPSAPDMAQLCAMLAGLNNKMDGMAQQLKEELKKEIKNNMDAHTKTLRDEMRRVGQCLQAGIMAPPRAGTNELRGSATAVRPAVGAGEEKVIRETCWAGNVRVTETVTVTQGEKLNG